MNNCFPVFIHFLRHLVIFQINLPFTFLTKPIKVKYLETKNRTEIWIKFVHSNKNFNLSNFSNPNLNLSKTKNLI